MQIRKINKIKAYKSFTDFSWSNFCKNSAGQEEILQKFSVIFGENGSGKSSTSEILKSLALVESFTVEPELAEVEIKNGTTKTTYKYEKSMWNNTLPQNSIIFFDVDFINANVHTHGARTSNIQHGGHTQKAGKLIIDLDSQANLLKEAVHTKKEELENHIKTCKGILSERFDDKDQELFKLHETDSEDQIEDTILKSQEELMSNEAKLLSLQKLNKKYAEISKLAVIEKVKFDQTLLAKKTFIELFNREIKEKAQTNADITIKAHFDNHRQFIESARRQIPEDYSGENCPLCMQPLSNATKVIEFYKSAFDQTYEKEKQKFIDDIKIAKDSCEVIKNSFSPLFSNISSIFDNLERIKIDYEISDSYTLEERTDCLNKFKDLPSKKLDELINKLELLKSIDKEVFNVLPLYEDIEQQINEIKGSIKDLNEYIDKKNQVITAFKEKYSDQAKLTKEIGDKLLKKSDLQDLITFLTARKAKRIIAQNAAITQQNGLAKEHGEAQEALKTYLSNSIPKNIIDKMKIILGKFNLNFVLEHIQSTTNTKDYSFSFKIKDLKGNERKLKEGLSEGERQLISLSFFFAINENLQDKQNKILIFDDPITSLDSPNLKILADLIHKQTEEFSQVVVFTHHPLFYKYLAKYENPAAAKFGVLKNVDQFGGSFIFYDPGFDLAVEIQRCNEEITQNAQNGNLKPEEIALKYGQLLRLSVEKFIKHDLLMWNKETNFEKEIISNLSQSKSKIQKLEEEDLEIMINIYKYCNYSNLLHIDKQTPSALSELITHISKFSTILSKVNN